jgi:hypothetical protein
MTLKKVRRPHRVNIVHAHHGIAPLKKAFGQVEAYSPCGIMLCIKICDFIPQGEASGAGYQNFHELNVICLMLKKLGVGRKKS